MPEWTDCQDPWHAGRFAARYVVYVTIHGGMRGEARQCLTCGVRTASILDEHDNDITERFIVKSWEPALLERVRESIRERKLRRKIPRRCITCRRWRRDVAWGRNSHQCEPCADELLRSIFSEAGKGE